MRRWTIINGLRRLRHFRGHGVHSPYVYSIVRDVFLRRGLYFEPRCEGLHAELVELLGRGVISRRRAVELHNIYIYCGYGSYAVDAIPHQRVDFVIRSRRCDEALIERFVSDGTTVVLLTNGEWGDREVDELIGRHGSTSVLRREYLLLFNNHLPKQHYVL